MGVKLENERKLPTVVHRLGHPSQSCMYTEENTGNSQCHQSADVTMKIQNFVQDHTNML